MLKENQLPSLTNLNFFFFMGHSQLISNSSLLGEQEYFLQMKQLYLS